MQGKKQYTEQLFRSFQLSQRVPEDNFYRRLRSVLDLHGCTLQLKATMVVKDRKALILWFSSS
jgi:hypothetical protein